MRLSRYLLIFPPRDTSDTYLLYSTTRGSILAVSQRIVEALHTNSLSASEEETLKQYGFLSDDPEEEFHLVVNRFKMINAKKKSPSPLIVLNLECNLACTYCYESGSISPGRSMSRATAERIVSTFAKRWIDGDRHVSVDLYGGEPLLSPDILRCIVQGIGDACRVKGAPFSFNLITNGTLLTPTLANELKILGLAAVKFTLDGPRSVHDRSRPLRSGGGSFDIVFSNLKEICDVVSVQLGGNYTRENFREFPELLDFLLTSGITPDKISTIHFTPALFDEKKKASRPEFTCSCTPTDEQWLHEAEVFLREEILRRGFRTIRPSPASCMIEFEHCLVINYDGSLYKCPAFIDRPELAVGHLATGVIDYSLSHRLDIWQNDECRACPYLPLCYGGCRYISILNEVKSRQ